MRCHAGGRGALLVPMALGALVGWRRSRRCCSARGRSPPCGPPTGRRSRPSWPSPPARSWRRAAGPAARGRRAPAPGHRRVGGAAGHRRLPAPGAVGAVAPQPRGASPGRGPDRPGGGLPDPASATACTTWWTGCSWAPALLAEPGLGGMVAVAVLAHEVPQEAGDFVDPAGERNPAPRALAYNVLSALTIVPGVFLGALPVERVAPAMGIMLAAAAGFLYSPWPIRPRPAPPPRPRPRVAGRPAGPARAAGAPGCS